MERGLIGVISNQNKEINEIILDISTNNGLRKTATSA